MFVEGHKTSFFGKNYQLLRDTIEIATFSLGQKTQVAAGKNALSFSTSATQVDVRGEASPFMLVFGIGLDTEPYRMTLSLTQNEQTVACVEGSFTPATLESGFNYKGHQYGILRPVGEKGFVIQKDGKDFGRFTFLRRWKKRFTIETARDLPAEVVVLLVYMASAYTITSRMQK